MTHPLSGMAGSGRASSHCFGPRVSEAARQEMLAAATALGRRQVAARHAREDAAKLAQDYRASEDWQRDADQAFEALISDHPTHNRSAA